MNALAIITFALATAAVARTTWFWVRRLAVSEDAAEEYFTGGRALSWPVVAGSLLLTNLSTEQLVGLNGDIFKDGALVGVAWEALAAFAMIATALVFLPRYLRSGFTTTPAFLEQRFDKTTRSMVSGLFLAGYVTVLLPVVLVTGSSALIGMFDLDLPFWLVATGIGVLGSGYAIVGGLKSVAISDTLNAVGLLIAGLAIPALGLATLGDGSVTAGLSSILENHPESLRVLTRTNAAGVPVTVPWPTLLTGMMLIQIFYWSTNQVIVQRAMAARSLAEGQKGVLFASAMKLVGPLMLCLPGLLALQMMGDLSFNGTEMLRNAVAATTDPTQLAALAALVPGAGSGLSKDALLALLDGGTSVTLTLEAARDAGLSVNSRVYGLMVRHVLPEWSIGLFLAVLVGSILSSFNSALNSASTLFSLQFYKGYIARTAEPEQVVSAGKRFGIGIAVASMIIAPLLEGQDSIFQYLQKVNGLYSVPIVSIFIIGIAEKRSPASGAKAGMVVGLLAYTFFTFWGVDGLHWLHGYALSFAAAVGTILVMRAIAPRSDADIAAEAASEASPVDMTPWAHARSASLAVVVAVVAMYAGLTALAA